MRARRWAYGQSDMVTHMKTTIDLPDTLMAEVKRLAAEQGVTMRELMLDGLRHEVARRSSPAPRVDFVFPTYGGQGLRPDIDPRSLTRLSCDLPE